MPTRKQIADTLRDRLAEVAERGRVLGQALKVRADMAALRRRLRATHAELGEEVYRRLRDGELPADACLLTLKERIDGLRAEVRTRESELRGIMQSGFRHARDGGHEPGPTAAQAGTPQPGGST